MEDDRTFSFCHATPRDNMIKKTHELVSKSLLPYVNAPPGLVLISLPESLWLYEISSLFMLHLWFTVSSST